MLANIFLLLIFLVCLAYLAVGLRRMEADLAAGRRDMNRQNRQQGEINGAVETLQTMIGEEEEKISAIVEELDKLAGQKEQAEVELQAAMEAPKQRLFIFDKVTLVHGKLWEVLVTNDTLIPTGDMAAVAAEWRTGRICLVGSATDRDARHRTESRFPSAQGYRIMAIERFRRG